jgi:hypothetical protein
MAKSNAGGGIRSRQVVRKEVRTGKAAQGKRPEGVSQIGGSYGNHATGSGKIHRSAVERVEGAPRPISVKMGNEVAKSTMCGPGGSRNIMRSGSQGVHGSVNPGAPTERRDILSEFGRESPNVAGRK